MTFSETEKLYIRSMGKLLRITAAFTNDDEANAYMSRHRDEGVVCVTRSGLILLANLYDKGAPAH